MPAKKGFDRRFPALLRRLHKLPFDYLDGDGIDFEPYRQFQSAGENEIWFSYWTGNNDADTEARRFRIFGQDGTGGLAGFWIVRHEMADQPIVFLGSEGEAGVVADSFGDYLWLLAAGIGPAEAVEKRGNRPAPNARFKEFAEQHAPAHRKTPKQVLARARAAFPKFEKQMQALCR